MFNDNEKNGKVLILVGICFTLFFGFAFVFRTGELTNGQIEPGIWGQFGDIVGGFVGTIVAIVGVLLLFETLKQQRRANSKQQVETRFFELIKLHRDNVTEMQSKKTIGRKVFIDVKDEFHDLYEIVALWYPLSKANILETNWKKNVIQITYLITFFGVNNSVTGFLKSKIKDIISDESLFEEFNENCLEFLINEHQTTKDENKIKEIAQRKILKYDGYQSILGHYFRHLFQTVTYINDQPTDLFNYREKYDYIKTLRAQLSTHEQAIFLFNSISTLGEPWELSAKIADENKKLITKYNFIKNIPVGFTRQIEPKDYFPNIYFETDDNPTAKRLELEKTYT